MSLRIAVISDPHCHPWRDPEKGANRTHFFSDGPRVRGRRHPIQYLVDLIDENEQVFHADVLVLPGDFTDQANLHGYVVAIHSIREIAAKLKVKTVAATIGNHDVDSHGIIGKGPFFAAKEMFCDFPIVEIDQQNSFFNNGFAVIEGDGFRILSVNSVMSHTTRQLAESGEANSVQLAAIKSKLKDLPQKKLQICLVHHHVIPHEELELGAKDLLVGGEALLAGLEALGFALVIHGHKHHPRLRYSPSGRLPIFASGSVSAAIDPVTGSSCRNTFHIIELNEASSLIANTHGRIYSWDLRLDKGWQETSRDSSSFPGIAGFGCHEPVINVASAIAKAFQTANKPFLMWEDVKSAVPQVEFLIPSDMDSLAKALSADHNLLVRNDPAEPTVIGRSKAQ